MRCRLRREGLSTIKLDDYACTSYIQGSSAGTMQPLSSVMNCRREKHTINTRAQALREKWVRGAVTALWGWVGFCGLTYTCSQSGFVMARE